MAPRQMTEHSLNALKGWPSPHAIDYSAAFHGSGTDGLVDGFVAFSGSLVSLNTSGNLVYGVAAGAMPMFLFQNSDDPDVANDGGNALTVSGAWTAVAPTGKMMALPACGSYELATTEFTGAITDYTPNIPLIADTNAADGDHADRGKVNAGTTVIAAADASDVVGIVSRVRGTTATASANSHGKDEVCFWPVYLPASAFAAGS